MTEGGTLAMITRNKVLTPRDTNRGLASMANKIAGLRDYNQPIKSQGARVSAQTARARPVYRSEFVIKLQTMREQKRGLRVGGPRRYEFLNEDKIEWMPSVDPIIPEKLPRYERFTVTNNSNTNISDRSNIGGANIHAGTNTIGSHGLSNGGSSQNHRTGFLKVPVQIHQTQDERLYSSIIMLIFTKLTIMIEKLKKLGRACHNLKSCQFDAN